MPSETDCRRAHPPGAIVAFAAMPDGWRVRTFDWPPDSAPIRGSILWLGGRGDFFEKYLESFVAWHVAGWSVASFDWRGQGGSGRLVADRRIGHIGDFATWIDDLAVFWAEWVLRTPEPHVLMGHSMGGHLVLRALAERRVAPDAVMLSAPMLGFDTPGLPFPIAAVVAGALGVAMPRRQAWTSNERPATPGASRQAFLTRDDDRYADEMWWRNTDPALALGSPSWGWLRAAYRSVAAMRRDPQIAAIATPMLIVGTEGDRLVSPSAIKDFAARISSAELLMFDSAVAHEVLRETDDVRDRALDRTATFLDRVAPARP